jgi:hypothetical protein
MEVKLNLRVIKVGYSQGLIIPKEVSRVFNIETKKYYKVAIILGPNEGKDKKEDDLEWMSQSSQLMP